MIQIHEPLSTFIHIPKTAGTSIHQWMNGLKNFDRDLNNHIYEKCKRIAPSNKGHPIRETIDKEFDELGTVFTVVRNPWDRFVSAYFFMIQGGMLSSGTSFKHFVKNKNLWKFISIKQVCYVEDTDIVMKFENITEDFKQVQDFYNDYRHLGHERETKNRKKRKYHEMYENDKKLIDIIGNFYQEDVEKFGYKYHI